MKTLTLKTIAILGLTMAVAGGAEAREKRGAKPAPVETTAVSYETSARAGVTSMELGVGYGSWADFTGGNSAVLLNAKIAERHLLQMNLVIDGTSPFRFRGGPAYKYTMHQQQNGGFHAGFATTFGNVTSGGNGVFYMGLAGLAGVHYAFDAAPQIELHVDGGPVFALTDGNSNFGIGALSPQLGASILYFF